MAVAWIGPYARPATSDAATVIAHLGVVGLLLGYLWARFRNAWPLLAIHAAINTPLDLFATVWR